MVPPVKPSSAVRGVPPLSSDGASAVTLTAWMKGVMEVRRWLEELPS